MIDKLLNLPGWEVPPELYAELPRQLNEIITERHPATHENASLRGLYKNSRTARLKAAKVLISMIDQNHRRGADGRPIQVNVDINPSTKQLVEQLEAKNLSDEELIAIAAASKIIRGALNPPEDAGADQGGGG